MYTEYYNSENACIYGQQHGLNDVPHIGEEIEIPQAYGDGFNEFVVTRLVRRLSGRNNFGKVDASIRVYLAKKEE